MNGMFISYAVEMLTGILGDSAIDNYYWIVMEFAGTAASVLFFVRLVTNQNLLAYYIILSV